ncbi:hypothetical protein HPB51_005648 [Rhipicephalus microplus]|uniref:A to I editase domain-containing protein n=1 Tax=Rhipicephalus microplus TaxID=6941 RepID=A0A9J6EMT0_RHIMP|nr:hypothetical protein HPB51_005648 [Rhipicephalus microplus]
MIVNKASWAPFNLASTRVLCAGNLYHHGHLSRAVCCRLEGEPGLDTLLPTRYSLHHPTLGCVSGHNPPRDTEKTKPYSINWCVGDERPEVTNSGTGMRQDR